MSFEPKKMAVLRILQILEKYSDRDHPLTQERILYYLERDYGIELERKAVGKNLDLLRDANYDIVSDRHGTYLAERAFDDSEVRFLIDSVLYAKNVGPVYAKHLVENLSKLGSRTFQEQLRTSYVIERLHDTKFSDFFYHIDLLQEAIERERKVSFWHRRSLPPCQRRREILPPRRTGRRYEDRQLPHRVSLGGDDQGATAQAHFRDRTGQDRHRRIHSRASVYVLRRIGVRQNAGQPQAVS